MIGANRSTGNYDSFTVDTWAIPVNGGYTVAPGDTTKSVALWCQAEFSTGLSIANAQLMVVNIQGIN
jgi:hypothetical protein